MIEKNAKWFFSFFLLAEYFIYVIHDVHKIETCGLTITIYMTCVYYVCVSLDIVKSRNAIAWTKELVVVSII